MYWIDPKTEHIDSNAKHITQDKHNSINLRGNYTLEWVDYENPLDDETLPEFRYLVCEVDNNSDFNE